MTAAPIPAGLAGGAVAMAMAMVSPGLGCGAAALPLDPSEAR